MGTLLRLLTEPPSRMPDEALAQVRAASQARRQETSAGAMLGYLAWFVLMPFELWMGVRSVVLLVVTSLLWTLAAIGARAALKRPDTDGLAVSRLAIGATSAAACATSSVCGPFVLVPTLAVINVVLWILVSDRSLRATIIGLGMLTILVPAALEWTRVFHFYNFRDGHVTIVQGMLDFHPVATHAFLAAATLALVGIAAGLTSKFRDTLTAAERRLHLQAWQLAQLVPGAAPPTRR